MSVSRVKHVANGDPFTLTAISMGSHTGTHIDAPAHFFPAGSTVDDLPLDTVFGDAYVAELGPVVEITPEHLRAAAVPTGVQRLLLKTGADSTLSPEAAAAIVASGIKLVGIEGQSVDTVSEGRYSAHRTLLGSGVLVVENLDLSAVPQGYYVLVCLPIKLVGLDGAPARTVLIGVS